MSQERGNNLAVEEFPTPRLAQLLLRSSRTSNAASSVPRESTCVAFDLKRLKVRKWILPIRNLDRLTGRASPFEYLTRGHGPTITTIRDLRTFTQTSPTSPHYSLDSGLWINDVHLWKGVTQTQRLDFIPRLASYSVTSKRRSMTAKAMSSMDWPVSLACRRIQTMASSSVLPWREPTIPAAQADQSRARSESGVIAPLRPVRTPLKWRDPQFTVGRIARSQHAAGGQHSAGSKGNDPAQATTRPSRWHPTGRDLVDERGWECSSKTTVAGTESGQNGDRCEFISCIRQCFPSAPRAATTW